MGLLAAITWLLLQGTTNDLTKETLPLSRGLTSDQVSPPRDFVSNLEQIFSPPVHLGYLNFRKNLVSHATWLDNSKMFIWDSRAFHHFAERRALHLTLHVQVKRQKREMSFWQTAKALQQLHVQVGLYGALTGEVSLKCLTLLSSHGRRRNIWWLSGHDSYN